MPSRDSRILPFAFRRSSSYSESLFVETNLLLVRFVVRHSFDVRLLEDVFIHYCTVSHDVHVLLSYSTCSRGFIHSYGRTQKYCTFIPLHLYIPRLPVPGTWYLVPTRVVMNDEENLTFFIHSTTHEPMKIGRRRPHNLNVARARLFP